MLEAIKKLADEIGLILNMRKTRIVRIDKPFRILQIQYWLIDTGRVVKKINPKSVTRERKKIKAYKRQLDLGKSILQQLKTASSRGLSATIKSCQGCR